MTQTLEVGIRGIGAWTEGAPDWPSLRALLREERPPETAAASRPAANALPATERRRAPVSVRLAVEVAMQACTMADVDPATLPCVFASTHGELAITDYVCEILARAPDELSPTRFHNSVLNAPAGYWTIATACTAASSAVTARHRSFAAGLLEAATFACAERVPVLFACCDVASAGPLATMTRTALAFGTAFVLTSEPTPAPRIRLRLDADSVNEAVPVPLALERVAGDNPTNAHALAVLLKLARADPANLRLPLSPGLTLAMEIMP